MYPTMTAGLITPLEEIPLFNGELEALLGESMCSKANDLTNQPIDPTVNVTNNAVEMLSDTISSPPSVEGNIECISTSGDSEDGSEKIPSELRLLQQKLSEGLVGCRWKARYPQKVSETTVVWELDGMGNRGCGGWFGYTRDTGEVHKLVENTIITKKGKLFANFHPLWLRPRIVLFLSMDSSLRLSYVMICIPNLQMKIRQDYTASL